MLYTLLGALILALPTFTLLWIKLRVATDDSARRAVPVRATSIVFGTLTAVSMLAGFTASNIQANDEGLVTRGRAGVEAVIMAALENPDPKSPAADISGGAALTDEQLRALGSGQEVHLPSESGRPASIQLHSVDSQDVATVRYDGAELPLKMGPIGEIMIDNSSGYPQLIPLSRLPARS